MTSASLKILSRDIAMQAHVAEVPFMRRPILRFVQAASRSLPVGSRVLDAGAGHAPYRELFAHCNYLTADFTAVEGAPYAHLDLVCDLAHVPLESASLDAILCTEVLEHVPEPAKILDEFRRLLKPGGQLFVTVPLLQGVHMAPYDFYRYTPYSLERLMGQAGFRVTSIRPHGGLFWSLAHFADDIGRRLAPERMLRANRAQSIPVPLRRLAFGAASAMMRRAAARGLARLDCYDCKKDFALGFAVHAIVLPRHAATETSADIRSSYAGRHC